MDKLGRLKHLASRMVFIDIEASDGGPQGWPIEIGTSRIRDLPVFSLHTRSSLIQPDPSWPLDKWSPYAERVHGISLESLMSAPAAASVAEDLLERMRPDAILISDSPRNDGPWLRRLMAVIGVECWPVKSAPAVLGNLIEPDGNARLLAHLRQMPSAHRAGEDSAKLARGVWDSLIAPILSPPEPEDEFAEGPGPGWPSGPY